MKAFKLPLVLLLIVLQLSLIKHKLHFKAIKPGHFTFVTMQSNSFQIKIKDTIPPHANIYFTNSKWNGNHFNINGSHLTWNTGTESILPGSKISFSQIEKQPTASKGSLEGQMKLTSQDPIFAYLGHNKMPTLFLAAVGTNNKAFGTLTNTQLTLDKTVTIQMP
ncbi:MAG: hypothetical protein BM564_03385 [Bacteroidetes bacterium MedPE-SWsnd-G2]|nr:MAG: hypothetical protein BM564_03385 [Bacteroidetes bacterium MedPE-SWsnd-G2]